jgi:hypothetical protein
LAKVNWENDPADVEANIKWLEERYAASSGYPGQGWSPCPNAACRRPWHGEAHEQVGENALGGYAKCPGSHMFDSSGKRLSDI